MQHLVNMSELCNGVENRNGKLSSHLGGGEVFYDKFRKREQNLDYTRTKAEQLFEIDGRLF